MVTKHEMDDIIARYRRWIDRPYERDLDPTNTPKWRRVEIFGIAVVLVLVGVSAFAFLA